MWLATDLHDRAAAWIQRTTGMLLIVEADDDLRRHAATMNDSAMTIFVWTGLVVSIGGALRLRSLFRRTSPGHSWSKAIRIVGLLGLALLSSVQLHAMQQVISKLELVHSDEWQRSNCRGGDRCELGESGVWMRGQDDRASRHARISSLVHIASAAALIVMVTPRRRSECA